VGQILSEARKLWVEVAGSEEKGFRPLYLKASISWAESGRDFRLSFCRRFWNQIYEAEPRHEHEPDHVEMQRRCSYLDFLLIE
jgi:hypothetical protein